ncbi:glutamate--cysteine ligase [Ferrimonas gelatinilytica]|uniref:Glutamate-cysteine ligase family protein n=1 Tax=Ferrimonas gelatinilytica TaxID=1255257 RepID=A0ABP9S8B7_9GAMM
MGQSVGAAPPTEQEVALFTRQLRQDLDTLGELLQTPGWGEGPATLGAELELYLTDPKQRPKCCNQAILAAADDPHLTPELNRFNLEYNCPYTAFSGAPFTTLARTMRTQLEKLRQLGRTQECEITAIGILPTLRADDFGLAAMTDEPRYHRMTQELSQLRRGPFQININGTEPLRMTADDLTLEGANTSFQVHLRVNPNEFASWYNAIQLATPFGLAMAVNAPIFLGRRLWQETRIPLFKQSIDCRNLCSTGWKPPSRVSFGKGYLRHSALELFQQGFSLYPAILPEPITPSERPGHGPELAAMRLHQGTIWSWNRPVYDSADGGHLRIEIRSLPAGPSCDDMLANAALIIGLAQSLRPRLERLMDALPFEMAEYNFYRAAQFGLDTVVLWPDELGTLKPQSIRQLLDQALILAQDGLNELDIEPSEIARLISLLSERLSSGQTGARWQLDTLAALEQTHSREEALRQMFIRYQRHAASERPVAQWPKVQP